ncbi:DUF6427 family protein [Aquimarina sp. 2201CG14-23]|uniref:DUF6427 family protein n=1 Tax=Aquimarina mycalae TaxID=3040073 RepID=UPI002478082C|nr:DUF6427 family protein [Aquimarina sp. 2201CG14-23]MDH7446387.1 DUF6427 family protein [Aquimarina sp. 2201CG14-23]
MLSSFFSKSKPINFIIVGLYMLVMYIIAYYKNGFDLNYVSILIFLGGFIAYIITMLVLNLITQKNDLTQKSTNTILLFGFLTAILPISLTDPSILLSNLFVIFAMRSVLNLRNGKYIKSNILDASICIGIASLTYFWSIGFILIIFLGVLFFEPKNYRNWIIPVVGLLVVYVLSNCFTLLFYDSFFRMTDYVDTVSFSFDGYLNNGKFFSIGVLVICAIFFFSVYLIKFSRKPTKSKPVLKLIIAQLIIAVTIVFIVPQKSTAEMIFIASPLAIIGTTYLEIDHGKFIKEINIWVFLLLPFMTLLF